MNPKYLIAPIAALAVLWIILIAGGTALGLPTSGLWEVALLGLVGWFLARSLAPAPTPAPADEPKQEEAAPPCECPVCRVKRGEAPSLVSSLPQLATFASERRKAEGAGVVLLSSDADPDPVWLPMTLIEQPDEDEPEAMDYLRAALDKVRQESGTDPRRHTIVAVVGVKSTMLYVIGGASQAVEVALVA
jgi:hypothetical protein